MAFEHWLLPVITAILLSIQIGHTLEPKSSLQDYDSTYHELETSNKSKLLVDLPENKSDPNFKQYQSKLSDLMFGFNRNTLSDKDLSQVELPLNRHNIEKYNQTYFTRTRRSLDLNNKDELKEQTVKLEIDLGQNNKITACEAKTKADGITYLKLLLGPHCDKSKYLGTIGKLVGLTLDSLSVLNSDKPSSSSVDIIVKNERDCQCKCFNNENNCTCLELNKNPKEWLKWPCEEKTERPCNCQTSTPLCTSKSCNCETKSTTTPYSHCKEQTTIPNCEIITKEPHNYCEELSIKHSENKCKTTSTTTTLNPCTCRTTSKKPCEEYTAEISCECEETTKVTTEPITEKSTKSCMCTEPTTTTTTTTTTTMNPCTCNTTTKKPCEEYTAELSCECEETTKATTEPITEKTTKSCICTEPTTTTTTTTTMNPCTCTTTTEKPCVEHSAEISCECEETIKTSTEPITTKSCICTKPTTTTTTTMNPCTCTTTTKKPCEEYTAEISCECEETTKSTNEPIIEKTTKSCMCTEPTTTTTTTTTMNPCTCTTTTEKPCEEHSAEISCECEETIKTSTEPITTKSCICTKPTTTTTTTMNPCTCTTTTKKPCEEYTAEISCECEETTKSTNEPIIEKTTKSCMCTEPTTTTITTMNPCTCNTTTEKTCEDHSAEISCECEETTKVTTEPITEKTTKSCICTEPSTTTTTTLNPCTCRTTSKKPCEEYTAEISCECEETTKATTEPITEESTKSCMCTEPTTTTTTTTTMNPCTCETTTKKPCECEIITKKPSCQEITTPNPYECQTHVFTETTNSMPCKDITNLNPCDYNTTQESCITPSSITYPPCEIPRGSPCSCMPCNQPPPISKACEESTNLSKPCSYNSGPNLAFPFEKTYSPAYVQSFITAEKCEKGLTDVKSLISLSICPSGHELLTKNDYPEKITLVETINPYFDDHLEKIVYKESLVSVEELQNDEDTLVVVLVPTFDCGTFVFKELLLPVSDLGCENPRFLNDILREPKDIKLMPLSSLHKRLPKTLPEKRVFDCQNDNAVKVYEPRVKFISALVPIRLGNGSKCYKERYILASTLRTDNPVYVKTRIYANNTHGYITKLLPIITPKKDCFMSKWYKPNYFPISMSNPHSTYNPETESIYRSDIKPLNIQNVRLPYM